MQIQPLVLESIHPRLIQQMAPGMKIRWIIKIYALNIFSFENSFFENLLLTYRLSYQSFDNGDYSDRKTHPILFLVIMDFLF